MKKIFSFFIILILFSSFAYAVPKLPMIIEGNVVINDKPAKIGTEITAKVSKEQISNVKVTKEGYYVLLIQKQVEGDIKLYVDKIDTKKILQWKEGDYQKIDLAVKKANYIIWIIIILLILALIALFLIKKPKRKSRG